MKRGESIFWTPILKILNFRVMRFKNCNLYLEQLYFTISSSFRKEYNPGAFMKKYFLLFSASALMILLSACETMNSQNNQFVSSSQDIIELQNDVALLKRKISAIQNDNRQIAKNMSSLQAQINYVNDANQQQNKTITALHQQLAKERAERQAALNKVVETVADETTKVVNSIAKQSSQKPVKASTAMPAGAYYEHKVERGQTLSAIARAYKVSVNDIKAANRLKSNIIRIGQILLIPKK